MFTEPDDIIRHLQHEKNVWRGIAIGLAATLVLLITLGVGLSFLMVRQSTAQAMRAEAAQMQALDAWLTNDTGSAQIKPLQQRTTRFFHSSLGDFPVL